MRLANEIRVGAVVLAGLFIIVFGYFFLRGVGLGADLYYLQLNGVATIAQGNDVRLQGVKIGQVQEITFDAATQLPILTLAVKRTNPEIRLLRSYRYTVQSAGIIGENYVDIRGPFDPVEVVYDKNDESQRIPGRVGGLLSATQGVEDITKKFDSTLAKVNVTLDRVNKGVLSYGNQVKLARALDGVAKLTNNAAQNFGPNGIRVGFGDPRAQANLNRALQNVESASRYAEISARNIASASGEAGGLVRNLRGELGGVVGENRGRIRNLLGSLDKTARNISGVTETLDFALRQGGFQQNAQIAFQSLRRAAENVEVATSGLRRLGEDQATSDDLRGTLRALRESTEALRDTAVTIRGAISDGNNTSQIRGALTTLGQTAQNLQDVTAGLKSIVGDPQLQNDVKGAAANLNGTLAATRSAAERVNSLLGGRRNRNAGTVGAPGSGANTEPAPQHAGYSPGGFDFTYRHFGNKSGAAPTGADITGRNYGDVTFNSEFFGGPFRLGLSNIGDGTDITAQTGSFFGKNAALRYGVYRSELGAGLELRRGRFSIEGNIYDPNNRSYNVYGGVQVTRNLEFLAGRENIRGTRANSIAVRITP